MSSDKNIAATEAPFSIRSILGPLVAIVVGIFMVILDGTAVNVALPKLQEEFNLLNLSLVQWTVIGYALAQASCHSFSGLVIRQIWRQENILDLGRSIHDWFWSMCAG